MASRGGIKVLGKIITQAADQRDRRSIFDRDLTRQRHTKRASSWDHAADFDSAIGVQIQPKKVDRRERNEGQINHSGRNQEIAIEDRHDAGDQRNAKDRRPPDRRIDLQLPRSQNQRQRQQ